MVTMFINLFVPNAPFLYTLKTENRKVLNFYYEQLQSHFQPKGGYISSQKVGTYWSANTFWESHM